MKKLGLWVIFGVVAVTVLFGFTVYMRQRVPAVPASVPSVPAPVSPKVAAPTVPVPTPAPVTTAPVVPSPVSQPAMEAPTDLAMDSAAGTPTGDKVELKLELPKAMFFGTPKQVNSTHLDPNTGKPRVAFLVAKDAVLLSRGKKATASDNEPVIGDLTMVTDGDKEGADGSFIEFAPGPQWVQVDLGAAAEIYAIVVWHYHSQARLYRDVIVQISSDPTFVKDVKTVYNNDDDNSSRLGVGKDFEYIETNEGRLVDAKGVIGRYVRCYSNGNSSNDMNHMIEIEVFGRPAK